MTNPTPVPAYRCAARRGEVDSKGVDLQCSAVGTADHMRCPSFRELGVMIRREEKLEDERQITVVDLEQHCYCSRHSREHDFTLEGSCRALETLQRRAAQAERRQASARDRGARHGGNNGNNFEGLPGLKKLGKIKWILYSPKQQAAAIARRTGSASEPDSVVEKVTAA